MRRRPLLRTVLAVITLVLAACEAEPTARPEPAPESPTPSPSPTETVAEGVPRPPVLVPDLVGLHLSKARTTAKRLGLRVTAFKKYSPEDAPGSVLRQRPVPGSSRLLRSTVRLRVAGCHPSYAGACLDPNAADYDCLGGTGGGPKYTGTVRVVGPDVFDLDGSDPPNGIGCEAS